MLAFFGHQLVVAEVRKIQLVETGQRLAGAVAGARAPGGREGVAVAERAGVDAAELRVAVVPRAGLPGVCSGAAGKTQRHTVDVALARGKRLARPRYRFRQPFHHRQRRAYRRGHGVVPADLAAACGYHAQVGEGTCAGQRVVDVGAFGDAEARGPARQHTAVHRQSQRAVFQHSAGVDAGAVVNARQAGGLQRQRFHAPVGRGLPAQANAAAVLAETVAVGVVAAKQHLGVGGRLAFGFGVLHLRGGVEHAVAE